MKHIFNEKTLLGGIRLLLGVMLISGCLTGNKLYSNSLQFDEIPPIINHRPYSLVIEGETLLISAIVGDDFGVKRVVLKIFNPSGASEGEMPKIDSDQRVPINIRILGLNVPVYTRPNGGQQIGEVRQGDRLDVFRVRDNFYLVKLPKGNFGYIDGSQTEIIYTGNRYGVQVPIEYLKGSKFQYQIIVTDQSDNQSVTDRFTARIVSREKYEALRKKLPQLRAGMESEGATPPGFQGTASNHRSTSTLWMIAGVAAIGGGVAIYYATNDEKPKEKQGTADITVDW